LNPSANIEGDSVKTLILAISVLMGANALALAGGDVGSMELGAPAQFIEKNCQAITGKTPSVRTVRQFDPHSASICNVRISESGERREFDVVISGYPLAMPNGYMVLMKSTGQLESKTTAWKNAHDGEFESCTSDDGDAPKNTKNPIIVTCGESSNFLTVDGVNFEKASCSQNAINSTFASRFKFQSLKARSQAARPVKEMKEELANCD
jgi:hypothetical protein